MDKPYYPHKPIGSVAILANTLGITELKLRAIASDSDNSYTEFLISDGKRTVCEPKFELKKLQKRINRRIFEKVQYPEYLQGGIKSTSKRDYVQNALIHSKATTLISLDIRRFFDNVKESYVYDVYKYLFKFPDEVAELLARVTTYRGTLPQGACTSTYLANLIFFNSEYRVVSILRGRGISYSRLLDDVTLSSGENLKKEEVTNSIKEVIDLFKKYDLRQNNKKLKVEYRDTPNGDFCVTGLWVEHSTPKLKKKERKYIRQLVYETEKLYRTDRTSEKYHELWGKASGKVAKLNRLGHKQSDSLRQRLSNILPEFDKYTTKKIVTIHYRLLSIPKIKHKRIDVAKQYNKQLHKLGILSRTNKTLAKKLRMALKQHFNQVTTIERYWHD
ncbi:reverse transcriptase family protein [Pseudoalteromonas sp. M8]|uniref:reverse transcriptase family protein n=1 Tax=Pseudoalteromonas sp. M8 TaxID=2692624 RepID=UPI001BA654A8|nr:reverse transcriptase family protein [Pseudoalteromonas sp. M8]QUI72260.1 RNA-directed DNA polymerase [Pseudoalteromonas sp. M8]